VLDRRHRLEGGMLGVEQLFTGGEHITRGIKRFGRL
jgi:hypothetical protein